jgi:hypothetical protein
MPSARMIRVPAYLRHKPTGQAVVTLNGKDRFLGKWNTIASRAEYDRLFGEWLAGGRHLPQPETDLIVAELATRYLTYLSPSPTIGRMAARPAPCESSTCRSSTPNVIRILWRKSCGRLDK